MAKPKADKIIGYSAEQAKAAETFRLTVAKNTPHEILAAFFPEDVSIGEIKLQPVDLGTFLLLEKIGSPLAIAAAGGGSAHIGFKDLAAALLVVSLDPDAAGALIADRKKFDDAVPIFARRFAPSQIKEATDKLVAQIQAGFATAIGTASPNEKASAGGPLPASSPAQS